MLLLSHFSHFRLCAPPQMASHQAPPSLGFSKKEHWSGLPFPSPVRTRHGIIDWFKIGKGVWQHCICHSAYLTYMQGTSCQMSGWMNLACQEKYQQPQICRLYHCNGIQWRGTEEPLDEGERREWKSWPEIQHFKNEDHGIQCHHFMANRRGKSGNWQISLSLAPKSLWMVNAAMKLKDTCS